MVTEGGDGRGFVCVHTCKSRNVVFIYIYVCVLYTVRMYDNENERMKLSVLDGCMLCQCD